MSTYMIRKDEEQFAERKPVKVDFAMLRINQANFLRHLHQSAQQC